MGPQKPRKPHGKANSNRSPRLKSSSHHEAAKSLRSPQNTPLQQGFMASGSTAADSLECSGLNAERTRTAHAGRILPHTPRSSCRWFEHLSNHSVARGSLIVWVHRI